MRALVISGGGSKGAFAGGVAQYLMQENGHTYDILIGSSTGSLLIPHLALGEVEKIYSIYSNVNMHSIFDISPFVVKNKNTDKESVLSTTGMLSHNFLKANELLAKAINYLLISKRILPSKSLIF